MAYHWKDGWMFERTEAGIRIYNKDTFTDITVPNAEWLSILKATDSMKDAVATVVFREKGE